MASIVGVSHTPEPAYEVLKKAVEYEVRKYPSQIRAITKSKGMGDGFRTLAGYIFGGNTAPGSDKSEKIAMTAPVAMSLAKKGESIAMTAPVSMQGQTMAFIMPDKYKTLADLPTPKSADVQLVEVPEVQYAVIRFNWGLDEAHCRKQEQKLREAAARDGLELSTNPGDVQCWGYNPPWTLPMFKRNEVAIPLTKPL